MDIPSNKSKVVLENIVFLQGDDYSQMEQELDSDYDPNGVTAAWIDESDLINYLLQWWYPGEHEENSYDVCEINTPSLGYERKIGDDTFLFSWNRPTGYAGLSRILRFED